MTAKNDSRLRLTQVRSTSGRLKSHIACVRGLGLRGMNDSVTVADTPAIRGMVNQVSYLLKVEEI